MIGNDMLKTGTLEFEGTWTLRRSEKYYRLLSFASVVIIISYADGSISGTVFLTLPPSA